MHNNKNTKNNISNQLPRHPPSPTENRVMHEIPRALVASRNRNPMSQNYDPYDNGYF